MGRWVTRVFAGLGLLLTVACNDGVLTAGPNVNLPRGTPNPQFTPLPCNFYSVDSEGDLWRIDPANVEATRIGSTGAGVSFTDITITPDNKILAITRWDVYEIDPFDAATVLVADDIFGGQPVAADTMPDGRLLVGGAGEIAVVDMDTGSYDVISQLPSGWEFSGDIAVAEGNKAYATLRTGAGTDDHLFEVDLITGVTTDLGTLGSPNVFGLDYGCDSRLYGVIADVPPTFLYIDSDTGQNTTLGTPVGPATLWGAAGPADAF